MVNENGEEWDAYLDYKKEDDEDEKKYNIFTDPDWLNRREREWGF